MMNTDDSEVNIIEWSMSYENVIGTGSQEGLGLVPRLIDTLVTA